MGKSLRSSGPEVSRKPHSASMRTVREEQLSLCVHSTPFISPAGEQTAAGSRFHFPLKRIHSHPCPSLESTSGSQARAARRRRTRSKSRRTPTAKACPVGVCTRGSSRNVVLGFFLVKGRATAHPRSLGVSTGLRFHRCPSPLIHDYIRRFSTHSSGPKRCVPESCFSCNNFDELLQNQKVSKEEQPVDRNFSMNSTPDIDRESG